MVNITSVIQEFNYVDPANAQQGGKTEGLYNEATDER